MGALVFVGTFAAVGGVMWAARRGRWLPVVEWLVIGGAVLIGAGVGLLATGGV